ncbi:iron-containing alcohol dehydrogenase [Tateyamaria pelophila]|uniref:iron-containing alcohol dehydrogenase n=1 Tax=Tateyamaria pelophila TaxID=328415 RepID=UPI001CC04F75|nr:iron-containing alcohol dehydrogenase [Tateyamaria pelophila]
MSLISYLTRVHFADNALEDALPSEIARHGIRRLLVLSDDEATGPDELNRLFDALPSSVTPVSFVADSSANYADACCRADAVLAEANCDALIGFGGTRAVDLARLIGGADHPVLTIPTRTGTIGLGPVSVPVTDLPRRQAAIPVAILCDATLTLNAGPEATAAAGMDTLVHCLESYLGTTFNPPADGIALDGLRRTALHIEAAVQDGKDITARRELLAAALNAGLAAEKGSGGIEAAAKGLETAVHVRHGVLHGAMLAEVLMFNAPAIADRFEMPRKALDLPPNADIAEHLASLAERIGLPRNLSHQGIEAHHLPRAARQAAADPANHTNPRLATAADYERMMRASL